MREGLIPTVLGSAVTVASAAFRGRQMMDDPMEKDDIAKDVAIGLIGFGLAHVVLGTIDLVQKKDNRLF